MNCANPNKYANAGDDESFSFSQKDICVKTPRRCDECGTSIPAGETHERTLCRLQEDSAHITFRTCRVCQSIRDVFFYDYTHGLVIDNLRDYLEDCPLQLIPEGYMASLTLDARTRVFDMIEKIEAERRIKND